MSEEFPSSAPITRVYESSRKNTNIRIPFLCVTVNDHLVS